MKASVSPPPSKRYQADKRSQRKIRPNITPSYNLCNREKSDNSKKSSPQKKSKHCNHYITLTGIPTETDRWKEYLFSCFEGSWVELSQRRTRKDSDHWISKASMIFGNLTVNIEWKENQLLRIKFASEHLKKDQNNHHNLHLK